MSVLHFKILQIALGRPTKERYIPFEEIAAKAQIDLKKVEFLVMKALSKGLVKGSIDQVNQLVNISWVQPRVLSPEQVCHFILLYGSVFFSVNIFLALISASTFVQRIIKLLWIYRSRVLFSSSKTHLL